MSMVVSKYLMLFNVKFGLDQRHMAMQVGPLTQFPLSLKMKTKVWYVQY